VTESKSVALPLGYGPIPYAIGIIPYNKLIARIILIKLI